MGPTTNRNTETVPSGRVLIVDDEPAVLKLLTTILRGAEYDVVTAVTPADGLKALDGAFFDLIITDAIMPTSGYDFVKAVRQHPLFADLPVLMLTKKRNREDVKKAVEVGVTDYVLKPIDEHLLLDKVSGCIAKKKPDGKKHVFELALDGTTTAEVVAPARIMSVSESGITVLTPFRMSGNDPSELRSPIFQQIGIEKPILRLMSSESSPSDPSLYESKFSFMGLPEPDLRKIRTWLQREMIRRRK